MSISPLQQQQQQQQQQFLNFNQLTIQTSGNDIASVVAAAVQQQQAPIGQFKLTTSPLNNLLSTSSPPVILNQQIANVLNDEEMSTSSSSASSTHSISSSSNSSIKDEQHLLALSPLLQQQQQQQQRNINTLLSSTTAVNAPSIVDSTTPNKCDYCKNLIINNTKLLFGCYHLYCSTCIEHIQQQQQQHHNGLNKIICPLCTQEITIVDTAASQQSADTEFNITQGYEISLMNLLNENSQQKHKQQQQQQQRCQNCKSNENLIQKCFSCLNQLCQNCMISHQYVHYIDAIDNNNSVSIQQQQQERLISCLKHKSEQIKYFCSTCNQLLCKECVLYEPHSNSSNGLQKHDYGLLNEFGVAQIKKFQQQIDSYKTQLQTILTNDSNNNMFNHQNHNNNSHRHHHHHGHNNNNNNNHHHHDNSNGHNLEQLVSFLNTKYHKAQADIDNIYQFYKQLLDERKQELKSELDNIYASKQLLIKNLLLTNKNDENSSQLKYKIENMINYTHKLMKQSVQGGTNLNELLLIKKPIEQKLQVLLQQLALATNDVNLNKFNKDLFNIEFVTNYSVIQTNMLNTFGYLKSNMNEAAVVQVNQHQQFSSVPSNSYKLKPIGPPAPIGVFTNTNANFSMNTNGNGLHFNDLLTFDTWSNGLNQTAVPNVDSLNDLATTLQAEQLLDSSLNGSTSTLRTNSNGSATVPQNGQPPQQSSALAVSSLSSLPARSQLKRQKMIYNCKFGEFGINDGQFTEPSGVAINQLNDIIVADTNSHRIQIFDRDGHFKFKFGECGKREGQLLYPNRVSIVKHTGDIIVTERSPTHQIQIYNQYGNFIRKFGANILQHPRGVCVDSKGNIIVVECKVMRVIIFDQYGNVIQKFSCSKYLEFPNGVCVNDKQEIFISDNRAHCIKVFNYDGQFLRQIGGEGITNYPIGVGINTNGEVLVADNHNNFNLTVFTQDGQLVNALESKVKHAQCFDVGLMDDGSIVLASKDYRIYVYRYISTQQQQQPQQQTGNM